MLVDQHSRPLGSFRLSVTDRCNLRCAYCMPEDEYRWLDRKDLLTFEELAKVASVMRALGAERLRLTGGEPLLRQQLPRLVEMLAGVGFMDLAMTTNGVLLEGHAAALRAAGLRRLTVSLDTLNPDTFARMARRPALSAVLRGIDRAREVGFPELKIDTVLLRPVNGGEAELVGLVDYARSVGAEIRFIEYMDVGGATRWDASQVVSQRELLERLESRYGSVEPLPDRGSSPAQRFRLGNGQVIGSIASVTEPFCNTCDRLRLTADGQLLDCLYARRGLDLRSLLREGGDLEQATIRFWQRRNARGAMERGPLTQRSSYVSVEELQQDPRLEMHTRGG